MPLSPSHDRRPHNAVRDRDTPVVVNRKTPVPANEYRSMQAVGFTSTSRRKRGQSPSQALVSVVVAAECREFTISIGREMVGVTVFESDGWRDRLSGIGGVTGTISATTSITSRKGSCKRSRWFGVRRAKTIQSSLLSMGVNPGASAVEGASN